MAFQDIAQRFDSAPSGTDAFKSFYKDAFALMKTDPDNAGLYFVVGIAAQSYVRTYEDQGISGDFAALALEPQKRLQLLGEVAIAYEWDVHDF